MESLYMESLYIVLAGLTALLVVIPCLLLISRMLKEKVGGTDNSVFWRRVWGGAIGILVLAFLVQIPSLSDFAVATTGSKWWVMLLFAILGAIVGPPEFNFRTSNKFLKEIGIGMAGFAAFIVALLLIEKTYGGTNIATAIDQHLDFVLVFILFGGLLGWLFETPLKSSKWRLGMGIFGAFLLTPIASIGGKYVVIKYDEIIMESSCYV
ncbi:MAG: hypothetical protein AAB545_01475, partial [Patescibacteria group bacterium]